MQILNLLRSLIAPLYYASLDSPGLLLALVLAAYWLFSAKLPPMRRLSPPQERLIFSVALAVAIGELCGALLYLAVPIYFDRVEPFIPSIAATWLDGNPIYPSAESSNIYGSIYGPIVFQLCAASLRLFGATVFSSKLFFVLAFVLSAPVTYFAIRLQGVSRHVAIVSVSMTLAVAAPFQFFPFYTRAEPALILLSSLALLAVSIRSISRTFRLLMLTVLSGLAFNLKIHAGLFFIPALFLLWPEYKSIKDLLRSLTPASVLFAFTVFVPFGLGTSHNPLESIHNYWEYLHRAQSRGLVLSAFRPNCITVFSIAGALALLFRSTKNPDKQTIKLGWVCLCCSLVTAIFASLPGAGPYHLLPYLPWVGLIMATSMQGWYRDPVALRSSRVVTLSLLV